MTGNEIRSKFLQFFQEHDHAVVASSTLVPRDDPTLLFTNAGMVQFKRVFIGEESRDYVRAASSQRCVRAGGKHNDLENVGHTARHHTFFEMLGNFSFGDYFKETAIRLAWRFLTEEIGLNPKQLWVSVFEDDDEAFALWEQVEGLPPGRIVRLGEKDNFWAMGDTGPCGPCSEIHIDQGPAVGCGGAECKVGCDCDRYLELWNLVFMQFNRDADGTMTPLPRPSIDTGMGLERIAAVAQGKHNNYDSDLFSDLINTIAQRTNVAYGRSEQQDTAMRVIADHARATAFLVADGVLPSNEGRGYVLRRIMRRAVRFGRYLGLEQPFLVEIVRQVATQMADAYPHLRDAGQLLDKVVRNEEERFRETLDHGLAMLATELERLVPGADVGGEPMISGEFTFKLYDTFGFPIDIVRDVAMEQGVRVDEAGFNQAMEEQRLRSKKSWQAGGLATMTNGVRQLVDQGHKARFVGYDSRQGTSSIRGMIDARGEAIDVVGQGKAVSIFCPETPFYAEAGGQVGDQGEIRGPNGKAHINDTITVADGLVLHEAEIVVGTMALGEEVELYVAEGRRQLIANNHTATHILHTALKQVLGDHVRQSGSLVTPDRLRFDFTHFSPITPDEMAMIETLANEEVRTNSSVTTAQLAREAAVQEGAVALFGEKYGDMVRVVTIGAFSKELCGGTHVNATGQIGLIKVVSETGIAAGIRRIEAITGPTAFMLLQEQERRLASLAATMKTTAEELPTRLDKLLARQKELEKQVGILTAKLTLADLDGLIQQAATVNGVKVVVSHIPLDSPKNLREVGDRVRDKLGRGVIVLGGGLHNKAALLVMVSKDLTNKLHAGKIIKEMAGVVNGSGGGRPDMAQAGGPEIARIDEALAASLDIIAARMGS